MFTYKKKKKLNPNFTDNKLMYLTMLFVINLWFVYVGLNTKRTYIIFFVQNYVPYH